MGKRKANSKQKESAQIGKKPIGAKAHLARSLPFSAQSQKAQLLESKFLEVSPEYLAYTQKIAFEQPLPRPIHEIQYRSAVDREPQSSRAQVITLDDSLECPRRPKWKHGMTKKEVEKNEEGNYRKWLEATDRIQQQYAEASTSQLDSPETTPLRSPTFFERNLQVWRQLWRVGEQSNILLVLLDIRCPPVHFPSSLRAYLRDFMGLSDDRASLPAEHRSKKKKAAGGRKRVIFVLTKCDLVEPERQLEWTTWVKEWWRSGHKGKEQTLEDVAPDVDVECVESYDRSGLQGKRPQHVPHIPFTSLDSLLSALRQSHTTLCQPPDILLDKPDRLASWHEDCKSRLKQEIDWDRLRRASQGESVGLSSSRAATREDDDDARSEASGDASDSGGEGETEKPQKREAECLTIGLIGQPNCGKSSLLNALLGTARVRASKTPGKTKHFQSIYWTEDVKIVDCPGLVFPSLTGLEMQVMSGILPISQIPSIPACMSHSASLLPLEHILKIKEPPAWTEERDKHELQQSKKTFRKSESVDGPDETEDRTAFKPKWTAGDILQEWALYRGYLTAKAGRPDTNRAGNEILRMIAEGRVGWRFLSSGAEEAAMQIRERGHGIWIESGSLEAEDEAEDETLQRMNSHQRSQESSNPGSDDEEGGSDGGGDVTPAALGGRFGALMVDEGGDGDDSKDSADLSDVDEDDKA